MSLINSLHTRIVVRDTGSSRGRGVFALAAIPEGDCVEVAPVLVIKAEFDELPGLLQTYVFDWETLAGVVGAHALALGFGCMYNHHNPANLRYVADARESHMKFIAVRDIAAGEELTINYNAEGGAPTCDDNNWFERHDIELIDDPL